MSASHVQLKLEQLGFNIAAATPGILLGAPIGRVQTLLQVYPDLMRNGKLAEPWGITKCVRVMYHNEGLLSFWRGTAIKLFTIVPSFIAHTALSNFKILPVSRQDSYPVKMSKLIAKGGIAGTSAMLITYPFEYGRIRWQADVLHGGKREFSRLVDMYRQTVVSDGVRGVYRGLLVASAGVFVYRGLYFGLYDGFKSFVPRDNVTAAFVFGYGVTLSAGLLSYPLDTVRKNLLMRSGQVEKYQSFIHATKSIVTKHGVLALWRGASLPIISGVLGSSFLGLYDSFRK